MFTARHNNYHPSLRLTWLSTFLLFLSITSTALGALVNVTVDDQTGDSRTGTKPTYSPAVNWIQGATCTGCLVNPDPKSAFHGTWHDSIATPGSSAYTVSYTFSGTLSSCWMLDRLGCSCNAELNRYRGLCVLYISKPSPCCDNVHQFIVFGWWETRGFLYALCRRDSRLCVQRICILKVGASRWTAWNRYIK